MSNNIKFNPFPVLETERLLLRAPQKTDAADFYPIQSDRENRRFMETPIAKTVQDSQDFIKKIQGGIRRDEWIYWVLELKKNGKMIGTICFWNLSEDRFTAEVGYELNAQFQRKGYMNETLNKVLEFGFEALNFNKIEAFTHFENQASIQLLKRYNFELKEQIKKNHPDYGNGHKLNIYHLEKHQK